MLTMFGAKIATRLAAVMLLATLYVACLAVFVALVSPWMSSVFSSAYGQLIGLLFPPVAGTVVAGLGTFWASIISFRYVSSLTKMAVG